MRITVYLKPGSKRGDMVVENTDGSLTIFTKEPAIDGRANMAAIRLIAAHVRVAKTRVVLLRGRTARQKVFEIND
jgi:UPF0235 protein MRA_1997